MAGDRNKHSIWALLLSLLALTTSFQQNHDHNNQPVVTPNEMVGLYYRDWPLNDPPLFLAVFFPSTRIFLAKAVCMVLGSSYLSTRKILVQRRLQLQEQVQPFPCKPNTENIWCWDDLTSRIFLVLGSFSLHVNSPIVIFILRGHH